MFEKIGKVFTAIVTFLGAVLGLFFMFNSKKQDDIKESFQEDKTLHEEEVKDSTEKYEKEQEEQRIKNETALRDLVDEKERELERLEERFGPGVKNIYEKNRDNPEQLVRELSEKYDLEEK